MGTTYACGTQTCVHACKHLYTQSNKIKFKNIFKRQIKGRKGHKVLKRNKRDGLLEKKQVQEEQRSVKEEGDQGGVVAHTSRKVRSVQGQTGLHSESLSIIIIIMVKIIIRQTNNK